MHNCFSYSTVYTKPVNSQQQKMNFIWSKLGWKGYFSCTHLLCFATHWLSRAWATNQSTQKWMFAGLESTIKINEILFVCVAVCVALCVIICKSVCIALYLPEEIVLVFIELRCGSKLLSWRPVSLLLLTEPLVTLHSVERRSVPLIILGLKSFWTNHLHVCVFLSKWNSFPMEKINKSFWRIVFTVNFRYHQRSANLS